MHDIFKRLLWMVAAVMVFSAVPAAAQISNGQSWSLSPGNAHRNNAAFDPINQVYLVIVKRPPVTGRFYSKTGVQIGPDFVIASEAGYTGWPSIAFGGPPNDPTFLVTYVIAQGANPKFGRLVRFNGGSPSVSAPSWILDVVSEWPYSEKGQNVWNGSTFIVGSRVKYPGASYPTFQVNHFGLNGGVSPGVDLGDGQDYYGSPAIACADNGTCLSVGYMSGIPSGYTGGSFARRFDGGSLQPIGSLFYLSSGMVNEDQGVVYQTHTGRFLTQWYRGANGGYIDTRLVGTDGWMSTLDLARGFAGPGAGCNVIAYNPATATTLMLAKGPTNSQFWAFELGDDGYPRNFSNWLLITNWDGQVLNYLPSVAANPLDGQWLITWEMIAGGNARIINGNSQGGGSQNPVQNGDFSSGLTNWSAFGSPSPSDIVASVNGGVLEFYRQPAGGGGPTSAVVLQSLGAAVGPNTSVTAQFDIGNSSSARKRITVIFHDADFSDLQFCTFWLDPNAPLRTYRIRTFTTEAWSNATLSFYAATEGANGGAYRLDNVSAVLGAGLPADRTDCVDPVTPGPPGGPDSGELITNGNFGSFLIGWQMFGQISAQVTGGVFQFVRPSGTPAGSLLQPTGGTTTVGMPITATFDLGNNSATRKRITVILHDADYSDLQGCSFWLSPGQQLTSYTIRTYTARAWANATVSFFLGNVDTNQWARIDNVSLKRTPSADVVGTECMLSSASNNSTSSAPAGTGSGVEAPNAVVPGLRAQRAVARPVPVGQEQEAVNIDPLTWVSAITQNEREQFLWSTAIDLRDAHSARLQFYSRRVGDDAMAQVQISADGGLWVDLGEVALSDDWSLTVVDLSAYIGQTVLVRFVHSAGASGSPAKWSVRRLSILRGH